MESDTTIPATDDFGSRFLEMDEYDDDNYASWPSFVITLLYVGYNIIPLTTNDFSGGTLRRVTRKYNSSNAGKTKKKTICFIKEDPFEEAGYHEENPSSSSESPASSSSHGCIYWQQW